MNNCMPRNKKEGLLYGIIICAMTALTMATINISINMGEISNEAIIISIKAFPIVFIIALLLENFIVGKVADKLVSIFIQPTDSLNAHILFRTFFTVIGMSIIMTNVGGILANGFNIDVIKEFPVCWPRNFCIVIFLELIIVQPIARMIMKKIHERQDRS